MVKKCKKSARLLNTNQTSEIIDWQASLYVIQLVDRQNQGIQKYEEVKDSVKQLYVEKLFQDELREEVNHSSWIIDYKNYDLLQ
jgi:hypothetical protein